MKTRNQGFIKSVQEGDSRYVLHPFTKLKDHKQQGARIIAEAEGVQVEDIEGNHYFDGLSGLWNVNVGHRQLEIADAVRDQMGKLEYSPSFFGYSNIPAIELARKVASLLPGSLNRVLFTCGGSESNESNIKMARYYFKLKGQPEKTKIISRKQAYHGVSMGALSATGMPQFWEMFEPLAPGFLHISAPYCYRCDFGLEYPSCDMACARELEKVILDEGPETVAAFIAEPVIGAGGVIVPPKEYFPIIRQICDKHDVLFIADEVITGFGRTGKMFGMENWGVVPDMVSLAKGITSGYIPLGAAVIKDEMFETFLEKTPEGMPFLHGFTYNGHPVACAAGIKNIEIIERDGLVQNAAEVGAHLQAQLQELNDISIVGEVRGIGMMAAIELVDKKETRDKFDPLGVVGLKVANKSWAKGLMTRAIGDTLALAPPLVCTEKDVDQICTIFREALEETDREVRS